MICQICKTEIPDSDPAICGDMDCLQIYEIWMMYLEWRSDCMTLLNRAYLLNHERQAEIDSDQEYLPTSQRWDEGQ